MLFNKILFFISLPILCFISKDKIDVLCGNNTNVYEYKQSINSYGNLLIESSLECNLIKDNNFKSQNYMTKNILHKSFEHLFLDYNKNTLLLYVHTIIHIFFFIRKFFFEKNLFSKNSLTKYRLYIIVLHVLTANLHIFLYLYNYIFYGNEKIKLVELITSYLFTYFSYKLTDDMIGSEYIKTYYASISLYTSILSTYGYIFAFDRFNDYRYFLICIPTLWVYVRFGIRTYSNIQNISIGYIKKIDELNEFGTWDNKVISIVSFDIGTLAGFIVLAHLFNPILLLVYTILYFLYIINIMKYLYTRFFNVIV